VLNGDDSARRPLPRRAYNCAHELGHHAFGHGSSIDELREDAKAQPWEDPKEFLADTFAGFILMPIIGLRRAFSVRGLTPETATPELGRPSDHTEGQTRAKCSPFTSDNRLLSMQTVSCLAAKFFERLLLMPRAALRDCSTVLRVLPQTRRSS
jgi:hypothetical protein